MADDTPGADQQPPEQVPPSTSPQTPPSVTPLPTTSVEFARYEASGASGPIPSPDILRAYEDLQPGTARRFIDDHFAQRDHERALERSEQGLRREVVRANHAIVTRGQYFGLIIVLVVLGLAAALGFTGHQQAASVFGGTTIIGLAAVFALGRIRTRDNGQGRS
jgi:uncharacterized membrane protein